MSTILQILIRSSSLFFVCITINCDDGEFFTSVETMEELFDIELDLLYSLDNYIKEQHRIIGLLTGRYEQSINALSGVRNREQYVSNPINAFSLIKRLTKEWPKTLSLIPNRSAIIGDNELPGKEDFMGAVKALFRLQDVYNFSAATLAQGNLPGVDKHSIMTAEDCAEVAYYYYSIQFYELATPWLLEALNKVDEDKSLQKGYILESLILSTCFEGDQNSASNYVERLLTDYPYYTPPADLVPDFNIALVRNCSAVAAERLENRGTSVPELYPEEIEEYNSICRAEVITPFGLKCHYVHYNKPHLRLAPFKLEELNIEPPIVLFHNVISDEEIKHMKNASAPYMVRAQIIMPNGSVHAADYRTSRIAWVEDNDDDISYRISQRVKAMTNLDIEHAEMNQVSNYGIAGEYISHSDAIENLNLTMEPTGNRLATFMFYMSEVEQGGHTVFPVLGVSIPPKKGVGIFWFNLHKTGQIDYRMRHASCPVVFGSKWVCNKWLHEAGQELRFPCPREKSNRAYFYL